jgi:hypothetical protein
MTDVRIICTYDAAKLAETLTRLLEAEQHRVRLTIGRQTMGELEGARTSRDAVMLIWSPDARSQSYMIEWQHKIDPVRLVEISVAPGAPRFARKANVIDFAHWRGERGGGAWHGLVDRLRAVENVLNPPKPPSKYAMFAMGMASAAAVTGAVVMRVNDTSLPIVPQDAADEQLVAEDPSTGLGGPLRAIEPASLEDDPLRIRRMPQLPQLRDTRRVALTDVPEVRYMTLRDETLLERLNALNPLQGIEEFIDGARGGDDERT